MLRSAIKDILMAILDPGPATTKKEEVRQSDKKEHEKGTDEDSLHATSGHHHAEEISFEQKILPAKEIERIKEVEVTSVQPILHRDVEQVEIRKIIQPIRMASGDDDDKQAQLDLSKIVGKNDVVVDEEGISKQRVVLPPIEVDINQRANLAAVASASTSSATTTTTAAVEKETARAKVTSRDVGVAASSDVGPRASSSFTSITKKEEKKKKTTKEEEEEEEEFLQEEVSVKRSSSKEEAPPPQHRQQQQTLQRT